LMPTIVQLLTETLIQPLFSCWLKHWFNHCSAADWNTDSTIVQLLTETLMPHIVQLLDWYTFYRCTSPDWNNGVPLTGALLSTVLDLLTELGRCDCYAPVDWSIFVIRGPLRVFMSCAAW
jgi:hypothetical protein